MIDGLIVLALIAGGIVLAAWIVLSIELVKWGKNK